jgi:hypothetical protein
VAAIDIRAGPWSRLRDSSAARVLLAHPDRTAAGLIAGLVLVYLWPVLIGNGILAPTALLSIGAPWRANASPELLLRYMNTELGDVPLSFYPWDVLARQFIHSGTFPAWNPHALAGTPLFANLEIAWLSPFKLPLWILPLNYGLGVSAALKLWMAGFGTYLLVRELRLGFWPAIVAGVSFTLCAFNVVWLTFGVFVSVAAMLPWGLWLTERIVRRGRAADGLWLALVVAVVFSGGHPGTQVHVIAGTALYALVRALAVRERDRRERVRSLALIGGAIAVGSLLMAVVLLPAQQAAHDTLGELARRDGASTLLETRVPFRTLRTALFPEWWGRSSEHVVDGFTFDGGGSYFRERAFYAGAITLVLAALALVSGGAWRRKLPFALLAALGAAIPLRAPLLYPLVIHLPAFKQVQNQRMLLWFAFAVAILSAFGLEALMAAPRRRRAWAVVAIAVLVGAFAAVSAGLDGADLGKAARYVVHRTNRAAPSTLALASAAWGLILVLAFAATLALARRRPRPALLVGGLVALLVAFDLLHFAHGYNPMGPASTVTPPRTPAIAYLQRHADDGRILGIERSLPPDWSSVYGLRDVRGYDAPQPTLRFGRLWATIVGGEPAIIPALSPDSLKLVGMLGGRYVVAEPGAPPPVPGLAAVYQGRDATIFENDLALPRAFVASYVTDVGSDETEALTVAQSSFDPRSQAIVLSDELGDVPLPREGSGRARVVDESNAAVTVRATLASRGLVVLDDQWMPGWSVRVDGEPAPILQADVVLRGVIVPAGTHTIEWSYRVPGLRTGAALSAVGLLALLGWGAAVAVASRRRQSAGAPSAFW